MEPYLVITTRLGEKQSSLIAKNSAGSELVSSFVAYFAIASKTKIAIPPFDFWSLFLP